MTEKATDRQFTSFDGGVTCQGRLFMPDDRSQLASQEKNELVMIPRGAGLSFSAASFGSGITSVDTTGLKKIESLDTRNSTVTVEAGVSAGILLDYLLSNGFYMPVLPGYPTITIGGCIAADVHGKNQLKDGNFFDCIEKLTLHHNDHGVLELSRNVNSEAFELTVGGFGLTGTILGVTLKVTPITSRSLDVCVEVVDDVCKLPEMLMERAPASDYIVSWHDFNQTGSRFGQGFLHTGKFANSVCPEAKDSQVIFPVKMEKPAYSPLTLTSENRGGVMPPLLNRMSTGLMNAVYRDQQILASGQPQSMPLEECFFPNKLSRDLYFHSYGKSGLHEHQAIVPVETFHRYVEKVSWWLARNELPIAMASAKLFAGKRKLMRFSGAGICFALDFPRCSAAWKFLQFLDELTLELHALPNLSKDSRLPGRIVEKAYGNQYYDFKSRLKLFDPDRRYQSELSRRLDL